MGIWLCTSDTQPWPASARGFQIRCSIVVSISARHAEDPGSIPGGGVFASLTLVSGLAGGSFLPAPIDHRIFDGLFT